MKNLFKWAFSFQQAAIAYVRGTFGMVFCFQTVNILFDLRRCVTFCFASTAQFRNFLAPSLATRSLATYFAPFATPPPHHPPRNIQGLILSPECFKD
jgi:hypothetical protein